MTIASGTCGATGSESSVTWRLEDDGTMYIEGTGAIADYGNGTSTPWYANRTDILRVIISNGITRVGNSCFQGLGSSSSNSTDISSYVKIPDSVESIGTYAFYSAYFSVIDVGTGVNELGSTCLNCSSFRYLVIFRGDKPSIIGKNAVSNNNFIASKGWADTTVFSSATSSYFLTFSLGDDVSWDYDVETRTVKLIGTGDMTISWTFSFFTVTKVNNVVIDDRITSLGAYLFRQCTYLSNISGGRGVKKIEAYAFQACTSLVDASSMDSIIEVGDYAFGGCSALTSVDTSNMEVIGSVAFGDCSINDVDLIKAVTIGSNAFVNNHIKRVILNDEITGLPTYVFKGCTSLERVVFGSNISTLGNYAFQNCTGLKLIEFKGSQPTINTSSSPFNGTNGNILCVTSGWGSSSVFNATDSNNTVLSSTWIYNTDHKVGDSVTWSYDDLTKTLTVSGTGAMTNYSSGKSPFYNLGYEYVVIEDGVTYIGNYAFQANDTTTLKGISLASSVESIGTYAFANNRSLESIPLPEGLKKIGNYAFQYCRGVKVECFIFPSTLESIGTNAFQSVNDTSTEYNPAYLINIFRGVPCSNYPTGVTATFNFCSIAGENETVNNVLVNARNPAMMKTRTGWKIISYNLY